MRAPRSTPTLIPAIALVLLAACHDDGGGADPVDVSADVDDVTSLADADAVDDTGVTDDTGALGDSGATEDADTADDTDSGDDTGPGDDTGETSVDISDTDVDDTGVTPDTGPPPAGSAGCGATHDAGFACFDVDFEGATRSWCLNIPEGYDPEQVYDLVIGLHGCGGNNSAVHNHRAPMEADGAEEFLFVYPQAAASCWEQTDIPFIEHMIAEAQAMTCLNAARTFVHGMSSGGGMSTEVAQAGLAIAFASVAGGGGVSTPMPAFYYSGRTDGYYDILIDAMNYQRRVNGCGETTIPIEGTPCVRYTDCASAPLTYCEDDRGHTWPREDWAQGGILDVFRATP